MRGRHLLQRGTVHPGDTLKRGDVGCRSELGLGLDDNPPDPQAHLMKRQRGVLPALTVVLLTTLVACSPFASKGTLPPTGPNGEVDASSAPDFLAVVGRDAGRAGYARKADILGPGDAPFPVYGDDLRTVVGQMVPGRGFVAAGVDPASVPTFAAEVGPSSSSSGEASGQVVLYVRNDTSNEAWITVEVGRQRWNSTGFRGQNMGVGCYSMPAGSRLVLLDRSPEQPGASVVRAIYVRRQETEPPSLWVMIGKDGSVQQGTGVPDWWGPPQSC